MKSIVKILFILIVPVLVGISTYLFLKSAMLAPLSSNGGESVIVEYTASRSLKNVCRELQEKKIIKYAWSIPVIARLKKIDTTKISAGEYELNASMPPVAILKKLLSGDIVKRRMTFREGQTMWEIGPALQNAGIISSQEFTPVLTSQELLQKAGINAQSFEGYLFPETYFFSKPITPVQIIAKMLDESGKHWTKEMADRTEELRMSRHDVLTLASIVEKESGNTGEQTKISSVFHNRLAKGMKLQADPTVIYGIPDFNGNLRKEDLQNTNNPYNTYVIFGLPPGPICNPGENAIRAALYPEKTDYLFFVADGRGGHVFSASLQEHNENVMKLIKLTK